MTDRQRQTDAARLVDVARDLLLTCRRPTRDCATAHVNAFQVDRLREALAAYDRNNSPE